MLIQVKKKGQEKLNFNNPKKPVPFVKKSAAAPAPGQKPNPFAKQPAAAGPAEPANNKVVEGSPAEEAKETPAQEKQEDAQQKNKKVRQTKFAAMAAAALASRK